MNVPEDPLPTPGHSRDAKPVEDAGALRDHGDQDQPEDIVDRVAATAIERLEPLVGADKMAAVEVIIEETIGQVSHHSGPLPRASELGRYNEIDATFAERIVSMAEREQAFRHSLPRDALERDYRIKSRGQHYAILLATLILGFAAYLAYLGNSEMAGKVAIGTLVGIVGIFVTGRAIDAWSAQREKPDDEG